jgi:hypothetical protein
MKQLVITCFALILTVAVYAQKAPVKFSKEKHSFGKIKLNKPATYAFTFTNSGDKPLVIQDAQAQCGCTSPKYSKGAIAKGKSEKIEVTYNAATVGAFTKTVTVTFAGYKDPVTLTIEGEVLDTAPAKKN